jgi:hypothetical protein
LSGGAGFQSGRVSPQRSDVVDRSRGGMIAWRSGEEGFQAGRCRLRARYRWEMVEKGASCGVVTHHLAGGIAGASGFSH